MHWIEGREIVRVEVSIERRRGCGHRKPDKTGVGIYLVGPAMSEACERLPYHVAPCNSCGSRFEFFRGWTEVNPYERFSGDPPCNDHGETHDHALCPMCYPPNERAMAMFCGEKFYSPAGFLAEAREMGMSKKVASLPEWLIVGKTVVYVAHNKAVERERVDTGTGEVTKETVPGIICCFRPVGIDLVVDDLDKIPKRAERIAGRFGNENCRVVKVFPFEGEQKSLPTGP